ncbi:helix-turn-helix transcriptional regulator [Staphylococcus hominis]|uniref:Helix-turn-helix transcriptional regulator n=1 Tax=Staphylococcus hominis TaxID=1290 RepID=A0A6N0I3W7_STAHO|nr:helix-turn-helix transcriptional regulator [Staphylococcus hominis]QKQ29222.1 helix-turn-helix transcriptional regulator [Staphylococcus hominis]
MNEFGKKIKELRGQESIRSAARHIGISHTYLDSLEKGIDPRSGKERKPTIEVVQKISNYYDYNFFELINLAGLFVSLSDIPKEIQENEINKMIERFSKFKVDEEIRVKDNYMKLFSNELKSTEVFFFGHIFDFFMSEKDDNTEITKGNKSIDKLSLIGMIFEVLVENKNSNNKEAYSDIKNEFDNFLRQYLDIK